MEVLAGILEVGSKILIARRGSGRVHAGGWEFPGGKQEQGETDEQTLQREFMEELGIAIAVGRRVGTFSGVTPSGEHFTLTAYCITRADGELVLRAHDALAYVDAKSISRFALLETDVLIAKAYFSSKREDIS